MLWKLADNVKYEDDCEVSAAKAGTGGRTIIKKKKRKKVDGLRAKKLEVRQPSSFFLRFSFFFWWVVGGGGGN